MYTFNDDITKNKSFKYQLNDMVVVVAAVSWRTFTAPLLHCKSNGKTFRVCDALPVQLAPIIVMQRYPVQNL